MLLFPGLGRKRGITWRVESFVSHDIGPFHLLPLFIATKNFTVTPSFLFFFSFFFLFLFLLPTHLQLSFEMISIPQGHCTQEPIKRLISNDTVFRSTSSFISTVNWKMMFYQHISPLNFQFHNHTLWWSVPIFLSHSFWSIMSKMCFHFVYHYGLSLWPFLCIFPQLLCLYLAPFCYFFEKILALIRFEFQYTSREDLLS